MPEHEPLDYRLRCHTKRTDLPPDVLRDIGEAYERLSELEGERDSARREICDIKGTYRSQPYYPFATPKGYAEIRMWDCFKDKKND